MTLQTVSSIAPSSPVIIHRSPWHSPVPYLFAGLAAMLSLIAFALLILACSYSNHAGDHGETGADEDTDLEAGNSKPDNQDNKLPPVFEEKYLVIMAGDANPTFLATPVSSRASSFGSCSCRSNSTEESSTSSEVEMTEEKEKDRSSDDHIQVIRNTADYESQDQQS